MDGPSLPITGDIQSVANALLTIGATYGLRVIGAIAVLIAGWMAARIIHRAIERLLGRIRNLDTTLVLFTANAARYAVLVFTFIAVLTTFGIATTSFVAVLGAMGLTIGLALQGTLSHFAAGIMLIVFRPYHVGDPIETGGVAGTISIINVFYSELETADGVRIVIPNGKLWGEIVKVVGGRGQKWLEFKFHLAADKDSETARKTLEDAARAVGDGAKHTVDVESVDPGGFTLRLRVLAPYRDEPAARSRYIAEARRRLAEAKLI